MELINGRTAEEIKRNLSYLVRCEICPQNHEYGCDYEKRTKECQTTDDALALIEHLEAKIPRWISVDERLPEKRGTYLCNYEFEESGRIVMSCDYLGSERWSFMQSSITHWMQLPEPPKEGAHE